MTLCIELIRQFYSLPRAFRITGEMGDEQFVSYENCGLRPAEQGGVFGVETGLRLPVFDIRVQAQKKNAYSRLSQNELAMQLFDRGFFVPSRAAEALRCLELMDFEGKDAVMQKIAAAALSEQRRVQSAAAQAAAWSSPARGLTMPEPPVVETARAESQNAPTGGGAK